MEYLREKDAKEKLCPFKKFENCMAKQCMAWIEKYKKTKRENHSGADNFLLKEAIKRPYYNYSVEREGPNNSCGYLILPEAGYCSLLFKD